MSDFLSEEAKLALSGSDQALMRLFPPSEEQYFKNDVISSEVQYPIDHLSLIDDNVTNTWMPLMGPRLGHVPTMQDWDILRQKFSHTMMEPSYRHDVPSEEQFTPMISSSASATDAHDFTTPSFSDKRSDASPSTSPTSLKPMEFGYRNAEGFLVCSYQGCTSRAVFSRGCDLRKHYKRHNKSHFCRFEGCPQSYEGGFSSKKDLARHEASHNPEIRCEWEGCRRVFSRVDNMRDHLRRIHLKEKRTSSVSQSINEDISQGCSRKMSRTRSGEKV